LIANNGMNLTTTNTNPSSKPTLPPFSPLIIHQLQFNHSI
jgi:hypothetical protein